MTLNTEERLQVDMLIGQMNTMSNNYASSESNDCRYVAFYMGRFAETLSRLLDGYYNSEQKEKKQ